MGKTTAKRKIKKEEDDRVPHKKTTIEIKPASPSAKKKKGNKNGSSSKSARRASDEDVDQERLILDTLAKFHQCGKQTVTWKQISKDCGYSYKTNSWCAAWKSVQEKGYVQLERGQGGRLTEEGMEVIGYVKLEFKADPSWSNEAYHEKIKSKLKVKGPEVFDLFLQHAPATGKEIAAMMGTKEGSHRFFYALQEIRNYGLIAQCPCPGLKGKYWMLSDEAFVVKPESYCNADAVAAKIALVKSMPPGAVPETKKEATKSKKDAKAKAGKKTKRAKIKSEPDVIDEADEKVVKTEEKGNDGVEAAVHAKVADLMAEFDTDSSNACSSSASASSSAENNDNDNDVDVLMKTENEGEEVESSGGGGGGGAPFEDSAAAGGAAVKMEEA